MKLVLRFAVEHNDIASVQELLPFLGKELLSELIQ